MRYIHQIAYADNEFKIIAEAKEIHGGNWHDFILDLARNYLNRMKGGDK